MLELLQASDDSTNFEAPPGFDWGGAILEVRGLQLKLELILQRKLELDDQVQDASFFADLSYSQRVASDSIDLVFCFRFSSFGRLFTVYDTCSEELRFPEPIIHRVIEIVEQEGHHYVDSETLDKPYSGTNLYFVGKSWWYRFFDHD